MRYFSPTLLFACLVAAGLVATLPACVTAKRNLCAEGGQPPRDSGVVGKGTKQCVQQKITGGRFVNHGKYIEWHPNGKRALEGEYASGNKTGKWIEWDDKGKVVSEKWYENGAVVPDRNSAPGTAGGAGPVKGPETAALKPYNIENAPVDTHQTKDPFEEYRRSVGITFVPPPPPPPPIMMPLR